MLDDRLQFALSQYHDGTLPPEEREAIESLLAANAEARTLLEEYARLDRVLKDAAPLPAINWSLLSQRIGNALDERDESVSRRYSLAWWTAGRRLAVAAGILLAIGVGVAVYLAERSTTVQPPTRLASTSQIKVNVPDPASGPPVTQIAIGPSPAVGDESDTALYSDNIVYRPSHIAIASGDAVAQDTDHLPF